MPMRLRVGALASSTPTAYAYRRATCRHREKRPRVKDIHAAVETLMGELVPPSSVKGALAKNVAGSSARFVRLARGRYILA
jgi:hypothetical protein